VQLLADARNPWDDAVLRALATGQDFEPAAVRQELHGYRRRFGRDRVAVLSYELLRDQPERYAVSLADTSARTFS
jgi:hypothetical protein